MKLIKGTILRKIINWILKPTGYRINRLLSTPSPPESWEYWYYWERIKKSKGCIKRFLDNAGKIMIVVALVMVSIVLIECIVYLTIAIIGAIKYLYF